MSKKSQKPAPRAVAEPLETDGLLTEAAAHLALAAPVVAAPSPRIKEQLLARIRASKTTESKQIPAGWRFESTRVEEGWRSSVVPGLRFKTLSIDESRDVAMVLIEMAAGVKFPDHLHDAGGDEGIVISGDVVTGGRLMKAGDYYFAAEGTAHTDTVSPSGCTALVSLTARAWKKWRQAMAPA